MNRKASSRRNFIKNTGLGVLGAGLFGKGKLSVPISNDHEDAPQIKSYRRLGRTEAMVSDLGCGAPGNGAVLKAALNVGVNFIETSESYDNGRNEELIGNAIRDFDREQLFIATKAYPVMKVFKSADDVIQRAEGSLRRLKTDYIDLYMIHQAQDIIRVKDDYFHRAADTLKKQGKIRFTGLSCHGGAWWQDKGETLENIMMAAIDDGRFDVLFIPYNFLDPEMGERILAACHEHDIGTMIMKSNPVLWYENYDKLVKSGRELERLERNDYERLQEKLEQAAGFFKKYRMQDMEDFKDGAVQFILSNPHVHTICCRFDTYDAVQKYIRLSGTTLDSRLAGMLDDVRENLGFLNCRIGCTICERECPRGVPVNTIMRYNYYFHAHRLEKRAMQYYRELPGENAGSCAECEGYCEKACPYGVPTRSLLAGIHGDLSTDPAEGLA